MITHSTREITNCGPGNRQDSRNTSRTANGLQPNRSARPAQTPAMTAPLRGRVRVDATEGSSQWAAHLAARIDPARRTGPTPRGTPGGDPEVPAPTARRGRAGGC